MKVTCSLSGCVCVHECECVCVYICMHAHTHTRSHRGISQEMDLGAAERLEGYASVSWKHSRHKLEWCKSRDEK